jgi:hypothetical protein
MQMKNVANWRVFEFLKESNGQFSSTRLFALSIVASGIVEWQRAIWFGGGTWHPDYATVGLIAGVLGIKVLQKGVESKDGAKQDANGPELIDAVKKSVTGTE